jgi:hypothetical protein
MQGVTYAFTLLVGNDLELIDDMTPLDALRTGVDVILAVGPVISQVALPNLRCVSSYVADDGTGRILQEGRLTIFGQNLATIDLPELQVGDSLGFGLSPQLTTLDFPALTDVRTFGVYDMPALTSISAPLLTRLCRLTIEGAQQLDPANRAALEALVLPEGPERDAFCSVPVSAASCEPPPPGYSIIEVSGQCEG